MSLSTTGVTNSPPETFRRLVCAGDEPAVSLLGAVLDVHLLFGRGNVSTETRGDLFEMWWPERSLAETLKDLIRIGLLRGEPGCVSVPQNLRRILVDELTRYVSYHPLEAPRTCIPFEEILEGFECYLREGQPFCNPVRVPAVTWGERSYRCEGRIHRLLRRPYPLLLEPLDHDYILKLCAFPYERIQTITRAYARSRPLRDRLALYALGSVEKINLTRSSVFVLFERYIRQECSLRICFSPALSKSLEDAGILSLRMG